MLGKEKYDGSALSVCATMDEGVEEEKMLKMPEETDDRGQHQEGGGSAQGR